MKFLRMFLKHFLLKYLFKPSPNCRPPFRRGTNMELHYSKILSYNLSSEIIFAKETWKRFYSNWSYVKIDKLWSNPNPGIMKWTPQGLNGLIFYQLTCEPIKQFKDQVRWWTTNLLKEHEWCLAPIKNMWKWNWEDWWNCVFQKYRCTVSWQHLLWWFLEQTYQQGFVETTKWQFSSEEKPAEHRWHVR